MSRVVHLPPEERLSDGARVAGWWEATDEGGRAVCKVCPRGCSLAPGQRGFCFVRENRDGRLVSSTYGRSTGFCIDPIEKKPLHQFYPGSSVLSFGTAGCNLGCKFCQNWTMTKSRGVDAACEAAEPEAIAQAASKLGCRSVAFTYNDPIVWVEYAIDTAKACRRLGVKTVAVTSGYMSPAPREALYEHIDAANVDLKGFSEEFYRSLAGGQLEPVLDTLRWLAHRTSVWLEITNLVIPGANDSPDEIERMCRWIADELGPDVPLHFSAFHPDFKLTDREPTPPETLVRAYDIARQAGLRYVYTGNVFDPARQATYCPACGETLIRRDGYVVRDYRLRDGHCAKCNTPVAGRWDQVAGDWGGRRQIVRIGDYAPPARLPQPSAAPTHLRPAASVANLLPQPIPQPTLTEEQQERILLAAGRRVAATVRSRPMDPTVDVILGDAWDTPVYGAFVTLKRSGQLRSCCGFLGQTVPLGEALDHAAVRAAKDDPRFPPIAPAELEELDMDVWLLWGLRPVTARGADRVGAITIGTHGLQVARGTARGLLLPSVAVDHHLDARGFLEQVCQKAGLARDAWLRDDTTLSTFEGLAIHGQLVLTEQAEQPVEPVNAAEIRPAAVAGRFYPGSPAAIRETLDDLFSSPPETPPQRWPAAMVPHAGWVYSGRLAAAVLRRLVIPERVIVLCPKHRPGGAEWAVAPHARWTFPGGQLASDPELAGRLADGIAGLELDARSHREEHAIEVQLPLVARLAPEARLVGITIGAADWPRLQRFAAQLAAVVRELPERPLLLISSDMNHFAAEADTRRLDQLALDAMQRLDPQRLYRTVESERISMCGVYPAVIVMETLRQLDALHCMEIVGHTTSAEASGDPTSVVGYAGVLLG